jgi:hypothetical protein
MAAFPIDLARAVHDRWDKMVAGDYVTPPCPPLPMLKHLLEACYLAANVPEETRYPRFNVIAIPKEGFSQSERIEGQWQFLSPRPYNVGELRRLAPAVDLKKSAIWVAWDGQGLQIVGLIDLGTSWHRARSGLGYRYQYPSSLIVQIDRPGRLRVYQGPFTSRRS